MSDESSKPGPVPVDEPTVISHRPPVHAVRPDVALGPRELGQTLVGTSLAHFQLNEFVGGGGMGAVFRATDTMLNRTVAVKVLSRDQGRDDETVRRFQNEAQSAARLDHENIARVYYVGEDDGWYFIVFEFIEGRNLRELVGEFGPMSLDQALQVIVQIAEALDHSAAREVVHRDIKPSNVLLMPSGRAKLVDMGLARLRPLQPDDPDLTASGVTLGTFDYISPEQARDPRTADVRSDIYSLGCTLYFMLTGQPPFPDGTVLQKLLSHNSDAAPDPRRLRPDVPVELLPVLNRMLAKKPSDRFGSPAELIGELLLLADRLGIAAVSRGPAIWVAKERSLGSRLRDQLPWAVPLVVLLTLAVFWDPAWLDGAPRSSIAPRFETPPASAIEPELPVDNAAAVEATGADEPDVNQPTPSTDLTGQLEPTADAAPKQATESDRPDDDRLDPAAAPPTRSDEPPMSSVRTLVVDSAGVTPRSPGELVVGDLAEACRLAQQHSAVRTIELRESGRIELAPLTLKLEDRSLSLVAAAGFSPVLSFRTGTGASAGDREGMIRVAGGELLLDGVHLEMTVPNETLNGQWSLLEVSDGVTLRIRRASLSIHNSYGGRFSNLENVSVFHFTLPDRADMLDPDMGQPRASNDVELADCVIRCEATVMRVSEAIPVSFVWDNGLLVSSERLARFSGGAQAPRDGERITLRLTRLTGVVDHGLAEIVSTSTRPHLPPIAISSQACVWTSQRWAALITQRGPQSLAALQEQLAFQGEQNAYEGMDAFWKLTAQDGAQSDSLDVDQWLAYWNEVGSTAQQVPWRNSVDKNRPIHQLRVTDFALAAEEDASLPADAATRVELGFDPDTLPSLPDPDRVPPRKTRPSFQF